MVGLQTLDLAIGVRVPASQPHYSLKIRSHPAWHHFLLLSHQKLLDVSRFTSALVLMVQDLPL